MIVERERQRVGEKVREKVKEKSRKMAGEDSPRSSISEEQSIPSQNQNPKPNPKVAIDDEELEEGEIVDEGDSSSSVNLPKEIATKHPLEISWTFWFDNPTAKSKQQAWGSSLRSIYTFSTIEDFWGLYNNVHHPSKLAPGADFYCFKNKIEPKWEDPVCANGGKWNLQFYKGKSDTYWLYTLLAMIGEQFDHGDDICGAVVNVRRGQERIGLWTKNASNETAQISIGKQWKELLDYKDSIPFIVHEDEMNLGKAAKNKYTV